MGHFIEHSDGGVSVCVTSKQNFIRGMVTVTLQVDITCKQVLNCRAVYWEYQKHSRSLTVHPPVAAVPAIAGSVRVQDVFLRNNGDAL